MPFRIIDGDAFLEEKDIGLRVKICGKLYPLLNVNVLGKFIRYSQKIRKGKLKDSEVADTIEEPYEILHEMVPDCPMKLLRRFSTQKAIALAGHLIRILHTEAMELGAKLPGRLGGTKETRGKKQEAGNREQETGNRQQETDSKNPAGES